MKKQQMSELSTKDLMTRQKALKLLTGMLAGILIVLLAAALFLSFRDGFNVLVIVPLALSPIVFLNLNSLNQINKELKTRT